MRLESFFEKFAALTETPEAVGRIRELLMQLAVRGKLVPQDLKESAELQLRLASDFRVRKDGAARTSPEDIPFSIPENWKWVAIGDTMELINGRAFKSEEWSTEGTPIIRIQNLNNEDATFNRCKIDVSPKIHVANGEFLISWSGTPGTSFGAFIWNRGFAYLNQHIFRCELVQGVFVKEFLRLAVNARLDEMISHAQGGVGLRHITKGKLENIHLPLPPLAEQIRIVAKVDELMALCDRLEEQQYERVTRHAALTRAVVDRFNEEPTEDNLSLLFRKAYCISAADLRRAIANLALRGRLAPRGEYAESVDLLLAKLQDERHRYATKYGFRTNNARKDEADKLYSIPNYWRWVSLSDLFYAVTDGDHLPPPKSSDGIAFLTIGNITTGQLDFSEVRYVPRHYYDALAEYRQPRNGDFLYTVVGATYGRPAPVDTTRQFCVQRHIAILKPCQSTNREFLSLLLKSPLVYEQAKASTTGTAQPTIPLGALRRFQVPLPPLSEQDRIARRVSELMALVDTMDEQLRRTEAMSEELLDAFIHLVLHPDKEVASNHKHDSASARAAIGCYAMRSLTQNASFGRTMLMKVFYLSEAHSGISQGWQPMRQAAGPYDPAIEDFELLGVQSGWFTVNTKTLSNGHEMIQYQSKSGMEAKIAEAVSVLGGQQTEFDRLLHLFQNKTTEEAEIIATLFAAWNDLLIDGKSPSDDQIIREVRENWHYKKERFTPALLTRWLNWLRQQSVIPRGLAPRTRQQLKLGLS
jgi:type I restriction enzyme S subunit